MGKRITMPESAEEEQQQYMLTKSTIRAILDTDPTGLGDIEAQLISTFDSGDAEVFFPKGVCMSLIQLCRAKQKGQALPSLILNPYIYLEVHIGKN